MSQLRCGDEVVKVRRGEEMGFECGIGRCCAVMASDEFCFEKDIKGLNCDGERAVRIGKAICTRGAVMVVGYYEDGNASTLHMGRILARCLAAG